MDDGAGLSSPPNGDAYRKRRDSYSAAMINADTIAGEPSEGCNPAETPIKSQQLVVQRKPKLPDNSSLESETWSMESSVLKRDLTRTSSTDTSRSWNGSIEIPEIFLSHPELLTRLAKCRCFLAAKLSVSSDCQCQCRCQCRCSQCQYYRRKISSCSSKDHAFLGGLKRKDSSYSVSTCQSILPPSSGRNSVASLFHEIKVDREDADGTIVEVIQRRHSDQTQSPRGPKISRADNRRFSEQTLARDANECTRRSSSVADASATKPIIARTSPRYFQEKIAAARAKESWPTLHNESQAVDSSKEHLVDKRFASQQPKRERKEVDGANERRRSSVTITPKMMRRRFSEQLILEGGLGSVQDYEDLVEEGAEEESLTAINARKRITLKRHYYPEGGWGHVIVLIAILVQVICNGLQLGWGVLLAPSLEKFHEDVGHAGRARKFNFEKLNVRLLSARFFKLEVYDYRSAIVLHL